MEMEIEGLADLTKAMNKMADRGSQNIARSVIRGALQIIAKQMKADLDPKAKDAKKSIKSRFKKSKKDGVTAKVGVGVGKRPKGTKKKRKKNSGVGIGPNNIHWWVVGTKRRTTRVSGSNRGQMPAKQPGLASKAFAKVRGRVRTEMIKRGALQLQKEVAAIVRGF